MHKPHGDDHLTDKKSRTGNILSNLSWTEKIDRNSWNIRRFVFYFEKSEEFSSFCDKQITVTFVKKREQMTAT